MSSIIASAPAWVVQIGLSFVILALTCAAGYTVRFVAVRRLAALTRRTENQLDDTVASELTRRLPFWALLLGIYLAAGHWPLTDQARAIVEKLLFAVAAASAILVAATIASTITRVYGDRLVGDLPMTTLIQNIVRGAVITVGALTILSGLGISIAPMLTALGVGGLAVALALQDTLANLFAGFYITVARQIRVGHYVKLDSGEEGYLVDIAWRSARIRTLPNNLILVPNSRLAQAIVTNFGLPDMEMAVLVNVGVDYASDLGKVERVTCDVARDTLRATPGGVNTFEPFIRFHTFGESSIDFTVILRAKEFVDQYVIKHEFVKRLHERYAAEGITIPFPIRTIVSRAEHVPERSAA
jgi:small-conductance mechanosensitive channel